MTKYHCMIHRVPALEKVEHNPCWWEWKIGSYHLGKPSLTRFSIHLPRGVPVYSQVFIQENGCVHPLFYMSALAVLFVIAKTQKLSKISING